MKLQQVVFSGQGGADPLTWSWCLGTELVWDLVPSGGSWPLWYCPLSCVLAASCPCSPSEGGVGCVVCSLKLRWYRWVMLMVGVIQVFFLCLMCSGAVSASTQFTGLQVTKTRTWKQRLAAGGRVCQQPGQLWAPFKKREAPSMSWCPCWGLAFASHHLQRHRQTWGESNTDTMPLNSVFSSHCWPCAKGLCEAKAFCALP